MAQLAIKGHKTRGKEVIQLLEMLGGVNAFNLEGSVDSYCYYIDDSNKIYSCLSAYAENFIIYNLEEFKEKFSYNVGDKVIYEGKIREITKMVWEEQTNTIAYKLDDKLYCNTIENLQPYEEETMEEDKKAKGYCTEEPENSGKAKKIAWFTFWDNDFADKVELYLKDRELVQKDDKWFVVKKNSSQVNLNELERKLDEALEKETTESLNKWLDEEPDKPKAPILSNRYDYADGKCGYVIPDGYEFDYIKEGFQTEIILKPKKPTYPKTYKECCECLKHNPFINNVSGYRRDAIEALLTLITCRDAYWKISGEEFGLGKPWEYDMSKDEFAYAIVYQYGYIQKCEVRYKNHILAFPTSKMRDYFYDNFKDLIEQCKELL